MAKVICQLLSYLILAAFVFTVSHYGYTGKQASFWDGCAFVVGLGFFAFVAVGTQMAEDD